MAFFKRIEKYIEIGAFGGLTHHEDFCISYIPVLDIMKTEEIYQQLDQSVKEFQDSNLKRKRKKLLKMKFTALDGVYARLKFHRILLELLNLSILSLDNINEAIYKEKIDILLKLLIVIRNTHLGNKPEFEKRFLSTILAQTGVREINKIPEFSEVCDKFQQSLTSIRKYSSIFFSKTITIREILYILEEYIDTYSNLFSRIILFRFFKSVSDFKDKGESFWSQILKNEV